MVRLQQPACNKAYGSLYFVVAAVGPGADGLKTNDALKTCNLEQEVGYIALESFIKQWER